MRHWRAGMSSEHYALGALPLERDMCRWRREPAVIDPANKLLNLTMTSASRRP